MHEMKSFTQTLEECAKVCGPAFHTELGKFRFLNEMIKIVSPKVYLDYIYILSGDEEIYVLYDQCCAHTYY